MVIDILYLISMSSGYAGRYIMILPLKMKNPIMTSWKVMNPVVRRYHFFFLFRLWNFDFLW